MAKGDVSATKENASSMEGVSLAKGWKEVVFSGVWKSTLLMMAFHAMRAFYDPLYCNIYCGLKLMNTSAPHGYSVHPFWKDLTFSDSACSDTQLQQYISNQNSVGEYQFSWVMTRFYLAASVIVIAYQGYKNRQNLSLRMIPIFLFCGYWMANVILMNTHFEQDITFLTGGILHHARASKPALDKKAGTNAQGYVLCGMFNRFFFHYAMYHLFMSDKKILKKFNPYMIISMMNIGSHLALMTVMNNHPLYHKVADGGVTPELLKAWPWTFNWFAYFHVIVHHDKGYSFGGEPLLDPFFDLQLDVGSFLHNTVFKLQLGSPAHYLFVIVWDAFQFIAGMVVIWAAVRVGGYFMKDQKARPEAVEAPKKKTQ
jgi:hypothetical protein